MFKNLKPLDTQSDQDLCLASTQDYLFAAGEMLVPVVASEVRHIAREYPLVFAAAAGQLPLALVGIRQGVNGHVSPAGHWRGRYVPSHIRRYPFMLVDAGADPKTGEARLVVTADRDSAHLNREGQGTPLFVDGKASPLLHNIENALARMHRDGERARQQTALLEELGLLRSETLLVRSADNEQGVEIAGLRTLNGERFGALAGSELERLHREGALALIYAHLASLINLRDGYLAASLGQSAAQPIASELDLDSLFGEGEDTIKFDFH